MSRKLHIEVFRYNPLDPASVPHMQSFHVEEYNSMTLFIALNIIREQQDREPPVRLLLPRGHLRFLRHGHQRASRPRLPYPDP